MPSPPLGYLVNAAHALGVELDDLIEDEWRAWRALRARPAGSRGVLASPVPLDPETADREKAAHEPSRVEVVRRGNRMVKRVEVGDCWFRTLDVEAGIRAYTGPRGAKRFWHGYYSGKAVDHYTGGAIPIVESASRQEYDLFDDHYDLVCELLGAPPETAIAGKGLSIERAFKKCTTNGTAPVFGAAWPGERRGRKRWDDPDELAEWVARYLGELPRGGRVSKRRFDLATPHGTLYVGDHLDAVTPEAVREPDVGAVESQRAYNDRRLSVMPLDRFYGTRIADFTSGAVRYFGAPVEVASLARPDARPWAHAAHAGAFGGLLYRLREDPERRLGLALFGNTGPAGEPAIQPAPQPLPVGLRQEVLRLFDGGYRGDPLAV